MVGKTESNVTTVYTGNLLELQLPSGIPNVTPTLARHGRPQRERTIPGQSTHARLNSPSNTPTMTSTSTNTPGPSPTNTLTPTKTKKPKKTFTATKTHTPTCTNTPRTNTPTSTQTPSQTANMTLTPVDLSHYDKPI
jgi:hypothetical protein